MGGSLLGIVIAKGVPSLMILLGFLGWTGNSLLQTIFGITAIPIIGCILLMVGGVGIHLLELFLG